MAPPPDEPRVAYRPRPVLAPRIAPERGFTRTNTSGLTAAALAALNGALHRLMEAGLAEQEAKLALDAAVRGWLRPEDAADADLERLLAWR